MKRSWTLSLVLALVLALTVSIPAFAQDTSVDEETTPPVTCPNFQDEDGDGVCDYLGQGMRQGATNRQGMGQGAWMGRSMIGRSRGMGMNMGQRALGQGQNYGEGPNFEDEDGDGVCDNFVDEDGDGICDNCQGNCQGGQGQANRPMGRMGMSGRMGGRGWNR